MSDDAMPPIATPEQYRAAVEALRRKLAAEPGLAPLVREVERLVRFEIAHPLPQDQRLGAISALSGATSARRTALISDIHGNHAGLMAVLEDIDRQRCDAIVCLGDLVEGGPDNEDVIRTLRHRGVPCVRGNHDETHDLTLTEEAAQFLKAMPEEIVDGDTLFLHISPRHSKRKIDHEVEAWNVFEETRHRLTFVGHVHVPMIFGRRSSTYGAATRHRFEYNRPFRFEDGDRYIVSVGSVGYGRDQLGKIRYAILDRAAGTVELRAFDGPLLPLDYTRR